jgi:ribosomal protein L11 methyltransferase
MTLLGFNGFLQEERSLKCFIPASKWTISIQKKYLNIIKRFKIGNPESNISFNTTSVQERNWNRRWEKQTGIIEVSSRIIIKPSWKKLPSRYGEKLVIHIDPKMSFGTGHHETTRLSILLLERYIQKKMNVLDFGCGTGVLGIACIKLGAKNVVAIDNDEWAIENTRENVKRNHVNRQMKILLGSVSAIPEIKFEISVANIDFPTVSRFIKILVRRTRKQGLIIISGILTCDMPVLLPLFKKNFLEVVELRTENEWTAAALRRI